MLLIFNIKIKLFAIKSKILNSIISSEFYIAFIKSIDTYSFDLWD